MSDNRQTEKETENGAIASIEFPDYMSAETEQVLNRCLSVQNEHTVSIVFITDIHHTVGGPQLLAAEAIRRLDGRLRLEAVVCGGDHSANGPKPQFMEAQREIMNAFQGIGCPFLPLKGNHDDNSIYDHHHALDGTDNVVFPSESFDLYIRGIEQAVTLDAANPGGLYYYFDIPQHKLRLIVLNCIDIPYRHTDAGGLLYNGQWKYAFSNAQLNWVARHALNFRDKPDPGDWTVVLFSHAAIGQEGVFGIDHPVVNEQVMWDVIAAYRHGRSYRSEPTDGDFAQSVEADFSANGPGKVAGCFFGHVHFDQVLKKDGIALISTLNATTHRDFDEAPERIAGTRTETAFDVVTIDLRLQTIRLTRFGAGEDRVVEYS